MADALGLGPRLARLPITESGCAGGVVGLARAADYLAAHPDRAALVLALEFSSLTFQRWDRSATNVVSTAIFGDGGAAAVLVGSGPPARRAPASSACGDAESLFFPGTTHLMGFHLRNQGLQIILDKGLAPFVRREVVPAVEGFLAPRGLSRADIARFILHPGGRRIIEVMAERLGLAAERPRRHRGRALRARQHELGHRALRPRRDPAAQPARSRARAACSGPSGPASGPSWPSSSSREPRRPARAGPPSPSCSTRACPRPRRCAAWPTCASSTAGWATARSLLRAVRPYLPPGGAAARRRLRLGRPARVPAGAPAGAPPGGRRRRQGAPPAGGPPGRPARGGRRARACPFAAGAFDVVTASLFLHHFDAPELPEVLRGLHRLARRALVVNDLRRARVPYLFGRAAFPLLFRSRVSVERRPPVDPPRLPRRRAARPRSRAPGSRRVTVRRRFPYRLLAVGARGVSAAVSDERRDVVVVGGGPAGSAAGLLPRQRGHDVLLLDAARFPRDKVCGEGVSPEAWRLLDAHGRGRARCAPSRPSPCAA